MWWKYVFVWNWGISKIGLTQWIKFWLQKISIHIESNILMNITFQNVCFCFIVYMYYVVYTYYAQVDPFACWWNTKRYNGKFSTNKIVWIFFALNWNTLCWSKVSDSRFSPLVKTIPIVFVTVKYQSIYIHVFMYA